MKNSFKKFRFKDLEVWRIGMDITHEAYELIKCFPAEERFGLTDQLRRAAVSIVPSIAEGSGQPTAKGFAVYLNRAKSSVLECVACLRIAEQQGYVDIKET